MDLIHGFVSFVLPATEKLIVKLEGSAAAIVSVSEQPGQQPLRGLGSPSWQRGHELSTTTAPLTAAI